MTSLKSFQPNFKSDEQLKTFFINYNLKYLCKKLKFRIHGIKILISPKYLFLDFQGHYSNKISFLKPEN